jgi:predicted SprT family Zn-dependent metalloprotease
MKDLQEMYHRCVQELASIGIRPGKIRSVTVNNRAKKRWGQAKRQEGAWEISISARLLVGDLPDWPLRDTMLHELLHCVEGCHGHTGKWARLAAKCNAELGAHIRTRTNFDGLIEEAPSRYVIRCMRCGQEYGRDRMSKLVRRPGDYRCWCGGMLKRVR